MTKPDYTEPGVEPKEAAGGVPAQARWSTHEGDCLIGRLDSPDGTGQAGSAECGAMVRVDIAVEMGRISDCRYQAYGCPATLTAAAYTATSIVGLPFLDAAALSAEQVLEQAGLASDKAGSAETAIDALHGALGAVAASGVSLVPPEDESNSDGVLVGMSGGVDSGAAALLLRRQGHRVVGITLGLWHDEGVSGERSCCSRETVRRARRVAHGLGIPHVTVDASDIFESEVVEYFVEEYSLGGTPNPCAKCNARVRFSLMRSVGQRMGLSQVATGHYARLVGPERRLARGADRAKDQSYVLAEVDARDLSRVLFPLGEMTKPEVRQIALEACLEGSAAPESQEICFIPDDDHRRFLRERLGDRPGFIVDSKGKRLAEHRGTYNYTIGQRKGLRIAAPDPLYVISVDAENCGVCVGPVAALDVVRLTMERITWHTPVPEGPMSVQVRSAGEATPARLEAAEGGSHPGSGDQLLAVSLLNPVRGVACGQTAVVYSNDVVVCAGTITSTSSVDREDPMPARSADRGPVV